MDKKKMMFTKGRIGSLLLKNRLVVPPMGITSDCDGRFHDRSIRYYEERAKGGFGLIITGYSAETYDYEDTTCNVLDKVNKDAPIHNLVERVHSYGTKLCMQLGPGLGRISGISDQSRLPYSASDIDYFWAPQIKCQALTVEQIKDIVEKVGFSASLAKQAGVDAVELRTYGGYLADQFMSEIWNKREDEYGGSFENRMRFTMELVESIQKHCGKDYPLIVKYNPYHAIPGGREMPEGIKIAKMLEEAGVAALHLDKGCYEAWYNAISTVYQPDGHQLGMAAEIRKHVSIPIISQGKLDNPVVAEQALLDGKTDFIALGHQSIADPHWPNKVKAGKIREIRPCVGCNECLLYLFTGKHITCAVNPQSFHEDEYQLIPTQEPKNILVIGAGPGGISAALTASERGHKVTLWEKSDQLGGLLNAAGGPAFKKQVKNYLEYASRMLDRSVVDVRMLKEADAEEILDNKFDLVIWAAGAKPLAPPIQGIDLEKVYDSSDVLTAKVTIDCNEVAVIGGGLAGCETAVYLAQEGKNVTIIEMLDDILVTANHCLNNDQALRALVAENNIKIMTKTEVLEINDKGIKTSSGNDVLEIPCGGVVLACGYKADDEGIIEQIEDKVEVRVIGDSAAPRKIIDAVHEGFHVARVI